MIDSARSSYDISRKPAIFAPSRASGWTEREEESGKSTQKTTIMEVNYGEVIAKIGKISGNKKKVSEILYSLSLSLLPPSLSFFPRHTIFLHLLRLLWLPSYQVTPKGIETSFNYKNSVVPCSLIPLPPLFMLYVLSASTKRRIILNFPKFHDYYLSRDS